MSEGVKGPMAKEHQEHLSQNRGFGAHPLPQGAQGVDVTT